MKYVYSKQWGNGNGVLNLTGAAQQIHELSLGMGHMIADGVKYRLELRGDMVAPVVQANQWVAGAVTGLSWAF